MEDYKFLAVLFTKHYGSGLVGITKSDDKSLIQLNNEKFEEFYTDELLTGYEYAEFVWVTFEKDGILFITGYELKEVA